MEQFVVTYIHKVWGSKEYFPGPQPVSIERQHFPIGSSTPITKDKHYLVNFTFPRSINLRVASLKISYNQFVQYPL